MSTFFDGAGAVGDLATAGMVSEYIGANGVKDAFVDSL